MMTHDTLRKLNDMKLFGMAQGFEDQLASAAAVFSFYANKTMTTGEGGMVVTQNADLAARMKIMRLHGISRDAFDRFTSKTPAWYYEIVAPGFKYNMTDMAGALGRVQLKRLPAFVQRRQQLAQRYLEALQDLPLILPAAAPAGDTHAWHLFVIRHARRDALRDHLTQHGVTTVIHYPIPPHRQACYAAYAGQQFPLAEQLAAEVLSLPMSPVMSDEEVDRVVDVLACFDPRA